MPPKKKKPPPNEDGEGVLDIFGYIDLIQNCLDNARNNESLCLDGISKADIALRQTKGDPDIQCIVLMKRAELLYIAVKNDYDTDELAIQPLDSCIDDCEQVLSKVSSSNGSGKSLCEKAESVVTEARQLKKTLQKEARAKRGQHKTSEDKPATYSVFQRYDPAKALFKHVSKINSYLLQDVVDCYKKSKNICRTCYYKHNRIELLSVPNRYCKHCKKAAASLLLIPASKMCENLAGSQSVAIPPPPKLLMSKNNRHKPFQMCKNTDHTICCDKSAVGETWFGHSIEELVVWTVERHYGCKFSEYIRSHHQESEAPNHHLFGQSSVPANMAAQYNEDAFNDDDDEYEYYPEECTFKNVAAIPQILLLDVIELYSRSKDYCKWCYYRENVKSIVKFDKSYNRMVCSTCHEEWEPVVVIPASDRCWNFGRFDHLPIAPWPQGKPIKDSFEYCQKKDHFRCFRVYIENEFWYPHSVEEMIVWTVERERGCSFTAFIESVSRIPDKLLSSKRTSLPKRTTATPTTPTKTTKPVASNAPTPQPQAITPIKAHPTTTVTTTKPTSVPTQKVAPVAVVTSKPAAPTKAVVTTSIKPAQQLKQEFQYATLTTQAGAQNGTAVMNMAMQRPGMPNGHPSTASGVFLYPQAAIPQVENFVKGVQNYMSSIQDFKPSGIQVSTVGLTFTTSPGGIVGSAFITTTAGGLQSPARGGFTVPPGNRLGSSTYEVQSSHTPLPAVISPTSTGDSQVYRFSEVNFKTVSDIPVSLLKAVSSCFQTKREVCRLCFYEERVLSELVQSSNTCSNAGHPWIKPLLVIQGCTMCDNEPCFERGESVPIPPLPPVATIKKCPQKNHHKCYTKSLKSNEMFAHSVEALVVWIVESEEECSFEEYNPQPKQPVASHATPFNRAVTPPPSRSKSVSPAPVSPKHPVPHHPRNYSRPYHPREVEFATIADIPSDLLSAIAECFKSHTFVCRVCFFDSDCKNLIQKFERDRMFVCPYGHNPWKEIKVIPKCTLCVSPSDWIPVPPLPKHMKQSKSPFVMCKKEEHSTCYAMSKGTNPWFPHTVEEMVIWTVERETDKQYSDVYQQFLAVHHPVNIHPSQLKPQNFMPGPPQQNVMATNLPMQSNHQKFAGLPQQSFMANPPTFVPTQPPPSKTSKTRPPAVTEAAKPAPMSMPVTSLSMSGGFGIQSPTFKLDLEEAIKLANNSSLAVTTQSNQPKLPQQASNPPAVTMPQVSSDMFGAFPNLLNIPSVPSSKEGSAGYLGLGLYGTKSGVPESDLGGFFPALYGGDLSSSDTLINSGGFGDHGEVGEKKSSAQWDPNPQLALHGWNNTPPHSTNGSHDTNLKVHDKPKQDIQPHQRNRPALVDTSPTPKPKTAKGVVVKQVPSKPQQAAIEDSNPLPIPRMPVSEPLVLEKALEAEGFVKVKSKHQKRLAKKTEKAKPTESSMAKPMSHEMSGSDTSLNNERGTALNGRRTRASTSGSSASTSQSSVKHSPDLSNGSISSNGLLDHNTVHLSNGFEPQENGILPKVSPKNTCRICYETFTDMEVLITHCQSAAHCAAVVMSTSGSKLPKYAPPHLKEVQLKLCKKRDCPGDPVCKMPHSEQQLVSWKKEWTIIRKSNSLPKGADPRILPPPIKLTELTNGLQLAQNSVDSQYACLTVELSRPLSVTVQPGQETVEWSITLQGQNWQTLFEVYCHAHPSSSPTPSLSEPIFKVTSISTGSHTFAVGAPMWEAGSLAEGLLLGKVVVCVVGQVESVKSGDTERCELRLNFGYKEFAFLPISVRVAEGASESSRSQPTVEDLNNPTAFGNASSLAHGDSMKPFVPQHKWKLSHGSSSSEELGVLNIEGEDSTIQHVPIEDWGCSLTGDTGYLK